MQTAHLSTKAHVALSCSANSLPPHTHGRPSCCVNPSSRSHMLSDKQHLVETMRLNWFHWFPATENPLGIWGHKGPVWRFQILIPCQTHGGEGGRVWEKNYWRSWAIVTCVERNGWMGIGTLSTACLSQENCCQLVNVVFAAIKFLINAHFRILSSCKCRQQVAPPSPVKYLVLFVNLRITDNNDYHDKHYKSNMHACKGK